MTNRGQSYEFQQPGEEFYQQLAKCMRTMRLGSYCCPQDDIFEEITSTGGANLIASAVQSAVLAEWMSLSRDKDLLEVCSCCVRIEVESEDYLDNYLGIYIGLRKKDDETRGLIKYGVRIYRLNETVYELRGNFS